MNCIPEIKIEIIGDIEELKHQDYHGKSIEVKITDEYGNAVKSKIDIGVHKHMEIDQDEYCFDVCMDEAGASLLKNSKEQSVVEKLRALLIFGVNNRRYKDIYDMYYLKDELKMDRFLRYIELLILKVIKKIKVIQTQLQNKQNSLNLKTCLHQIISKLLLTM